MAEGKKNAETSESRDLAEISNYSVDDAARDIEGLRDTLGQAAREAVDTMTEIMRSAGKDETRLKASSEILDRYGLTKEQKISVTHRNINPKTIQAALQGMAHIAGEPVDFEDAEYEQLGDETDVSSTAEDGESHAERQTEGQDAASWSSSYPSDFLSGLGGEQ